MAAGIEPQLHGLAIHTQTGSNLSPDRKSSIEHALRKYRSRVLELNMNTLISVIQQIEATTSYKRADFWDSVPDDLRSMRLQAIIERHGIHLEDDSISEVRELLSEDHREDLVRTNRLDGVRHGQVDVDARNAWIERTETAMANAKRASIQPDGLPPALKYLMTLVRAICGVGLPRYRYYGELYQLKFLSDVHMDEDEDGSNEDGWVALPITLDTPPEDIKNDPSLGLPQEWADCEVALGVQIGYGGFAVYSRRLKGEESQSVRDGAGVQGWDWRYGLTDFEYESDLYDTIEEFLEFYA
ncbi:hypothetical protein KC332_g6502 [Hortaea werneckii]|nr:hypothetical protein KC358_g6221 [Hortaea werneckii]OTA22017.1 hypothetical protein BTJ68_15422 [Hortaea werneckii EXF-2000]KAI6839637.1 hypothetical protein KC350_g5604 [Hortaea werneckii]KAI6934438.1 hypothetical protein KC348_g6493 [Hortaea werneckii]KAI6936785.1 hypothetical protein KC341_g6018 [Hortaea werneckii]